MEPKPAPNPEKETNQRHVALVAGWTLLSRVTGLVRVVVIGAVLGPTFFANIFQTINVIPNLTYNLFAGSLIASLLVPPLVESLHRGGQQAVKELSRRFLSLIMAGMALVGLAVVVAAWPLSRLITASIRNPALHETSGNQALIMLVLVVPQIVLYGVAAVGGAVQNANGRFALAAAAPALENLGLIITMILCALLFGKGLEADRVGNRQLVLLAVGSTLSVSIHALVQFVGASQAIGGLLLPRWHWKNDATRSLLPRLGTSIGTGACAAAWTLLCTLAAGLLAGGVVAFQTGLAFYSFPVAVAARAVGTTLLPRLSHLAGVGDRSRFAQTYRSGLRTALSLVVPIAIFLFVLSGYLARLISFGAMAHGDGLNLVNLAIRSLSLAVVGGSIYEVASQACFACYDAKSAFTANLGRLGVVGGGLVVALLVPKSGLVLVAVCAAVVAGECTAAYVMHRAVSLRLTVTGQRPTKRRHRFESTRVFGIPVVSASVGMLLPPLFRSNDHLDAFAHLTVASWVFALLSIAVNWKWIQNHRGRFAHLVPRTQRRHSKKFTNVFVFLTVQLVFVLSALSGPLPILAGLLVAGMVWDVRRHRGLQQRRGSVPVMSLQLRDRVQGSAFTRALSVPALIQFAGWKNRRTVPVLKKPRWNSFLRALLIRLNGWIRAHFGYTRRSVRELRQRPTSMALVLFALVVVPVLAAGVVFLGLVPVFGALCVVGIVCVVTVRPSYAAYIYLCLVPFITGIERGKLLPLLRPNEGLEVLLLLALVLNGVKTWSRGATLRVIVSTSDRAFLTLVLLGSVWPLAWLSLRGLPTKVSDVMAVLPLWRLLGLLVLFRVAVRTQTEVRNCCWIVLVSAVPLAVLAVLQSRGVGVIDFALSGLWGDNSAGRGGATLGSSIAVGDYLSFCFALGLLMRHHRKEHSRLLAGLAGVCALGALGSGQFSGFIGVVVVSVIVAQRTGAIRQMVKWAVPIGVVSASVIGPVVAQRFSGFTSEFGLPRSWLGRMDNLTNFYLPRLGNFRFLFGVSPDSVLQAPETWREQIFLESGHLWFLWVGGVPMLCVFFWWLHAARNEAALAARSSDLDRSIAAEASRVALTLMAALTLIDMHLTLRGSADLLVVLFALGSGALRVKPIARPQRKPLVQTTRMALS
jgi:peptidoglycan biosynthesis protein MviN/MurJ (putative lipid II flippase)